jgi:hypothetical protein
MRSAIRAQTLRAFAEELLFAAGVVGVATIWFVLRSAISWQVLVVPPHVPLLLVLLGQALPAVAVATILLLVRFRGGNVTRLRVWLAAGAITFVAAHAAGLGFRHIAAEVDPASLELWVLLVMHTVLLAGATIAIFWLIRRYEQQTTSALRTLGVLALLSTVVVTPALVVEGDERPSYVLVEGDAPALRLDGGARELTPVYILVLDELSYPALLDAEGAIDADRFPNIARVADEGVLFTNATANYFNTSYALPALVETLTPFTGAGELRVHTQYHEVQAALDPVCRERVVCAGIDEAASDSARTLRHFLVAFAEDLVPAPFSSFTRGPLNSMASHVGVPTSAADRTALHLYSEELTALALDGIERDSAANSITIIHSLASHHPFVLDADGAAHDRAYTIHADGYYRANELRFTGSVNDTWAVPAGFEPQLEPPALEGLMASYLAQIAYGDTMLGELLTRLEGEGLLDESILVVTSDHGLRQDLRADEPSIEVDQWVAHIPLIVRGPGIEPAVRNEPVQYRDIAATVFDLVGIELSTPADTLSAFDSRSGDERQRWLLVSGLWLHYERGSGSWSTVAELPVTSKRDRGSNLPQLDGALTACLTTLSGCHSDLLVDAAAVAQLEASRRR